MLTNQIDQLGEAGAATGAQEGHLVTVQELIQVYRGDTLPRHSTGANKGIQGGGYLVTIQYK